MTLTAGFHHIATHTDDLDRLIDFYDEVFDADIDWVRGDPGFRHAFIRIGGNAVLHPFEIAGNEHRTGSDAELDRGHVDHLALVVEGDGEFDELRRRLVDRGASDGAVTDYGSMRCVHYVDPDGMHAEVCQWQDGAFSDPHAPT